MSKLPTQLEWRRFVAAAKVLGYEQLPSSGGSARNFYNPNREPAVVTVHEPHKGDTIKQGTLSEYLRKFHISREQFFEALGGERAEASEAEEPVCCICHEEIEPLQPAMKHRFNGLPVHTECHVRTFGMP